MSTRQSDTQPTSTAAAVEQLTGAFSEFREKHLSTQDDLISRLQKLEIKADTPEFTSGNSDNSGLRKGMADFYRKGDVSTLREKGMSIAVDAGGGYLHVPELGQQIIGAIGIDSALFRDVTKITTDSNEFRQAYTVTGPAAARSAESGSRSASDSPVLARVDIPMFDLYSYVALTQELVDSAEFDVEAYVRGEVERQFMAAIESEIVSGSGTTQALGILTRATSASLDTSSPVRPFGTYQFLARGINSPLSSFNYNGLVDLVAALPARYKRGARFYCSTSAIQTMRKMVDTANMPLWRDASGGIAGAPQSILGYEVIECETLPAVALNTMPVVFGNMPQAYLWATHSRGLRVVRDNVTTPGTIKLYCSLQCSGKPGDTRALKALKVA